MTKQSVAFVPTDLTDELLLRRTLSIIIAEINKIRGLDGNTDAFTLKDKEQDARLDKLTENIRKSLFGIEQKINQNTTDIEANTANIQALATSRVASAVLSYDGSSYSLSADVNIASHNRTGVGVHEFDITQTTVGGVNVLDNVTAAISWSMSGGDESVRYDKVDTDTFKLTITDSGLAYDLVAGEFVHVTLFFNPPGAELPDA